MAKEIIVQTLPCVLTREELEDRSRRLAAAVQASGELEKEKKAINDQIKAREAAFDAEIANMSGQITSGKEYRQIECVWEFDWKEGVKFFVRSDTQETIQTQKITDNERQDRIQ